jgi:hypothetical protein
MLAFTDHYALMIFSSFKALRFIIRHCTNFYHCRTFHYLYFSFVKSRLEYDCILWCTCYTSHCLKIKEIRRTFFEFHFSRLVYSLREVFFGKRTQFMASQDGVNTFAVLKQQIPNILRFACKTQLETQMHLLLACHSYAGSVHMDLYNVALQVIYYHLTHAYSLNWTPVLPWASGKIESIMKNAK